MMYDRLGLETIGDLQIAKEYNDYSQEAQETVRQ